jgi:multidrug efflux pump
MRVWLDPHKVAAPAHGRRGDRRREQNIQVSAGQLGAEPSAQKSDKLLSINVRGG